VQRASFGPRSCDRERTGRSVGSDDSPGVPDQFCGQECHITGATADIQNAHARYNSGLAQKLSRERLEEACLRIQALDLSVRVAEHIGRDPVGGAFFGHAW
jgi:hypothetical protein